MRSHRLNSFVRVAALATGCCFASQCTPQNPCDGTPGQGQCDTLNPCTVNVKTEDAYSVYYKSSSPLTQAIFLPSRPSQSLSISPALHRAGDANRYGTASSSVQNDYLTYTYIYEYDKRRRLVTFGPDKDENGSLDYEEEVYTYNDDDQVTRMVREFPGSGVVYQIDYTYEEGLLVLTYVPDLQFAGRTSHYYWSPERWLTSVEENLNNGTPVQLSTLRYDSTGHVVEYLEDYEPPNPPVDDTRRYEWSGEQLVKAEFYDGENTSPSSSETYTYDAQGHLIKRATGSGQSSVTTYTWEGDHLVAINDTTLSYDHNGNLVKVERLDSSGDIDSRISISSNCQSPWPTSFDFTSIDSLPPF